MSRGREKQMEPLRHKRTEPRKIEGPTVHIRPKLHARLQETARRKNTYINEIVRVAVEEWLERNVE